MEKRAEMRKSQGRPMRKLEIRKEIGPYRPLARSWMKVERSSRYAGT